MTARATAITASGAAGATPLPPLGSAVVMGAAFMLALAVSPGPDAAIGAAVLLLAVQIGLELRLAGSIASRSAGETGLRHAVRMVAPVRHAVLLFAVCLATAGLGHAGLAAAVSLCLFMAIMVLEAAAIIALSILAGLPGLAALHLSEGTFGLAGETV